MKKFPDFVPPTKVSYLLDRGPTLHLRRCMLQAVDDPTQEWTFDKEEIRIGSMDDNDIVLDDDTVSRYHCKIVQEDTGYVLDRPALDQRHVHQQGPRPRGVPQAGLHAARRRPEPAPVQRAARKRSRSSRRAAIAAAGLIGGNARMREIYSIIEKIAPTATTVVIDGETGTGKEVVAQAIHSLSPRSRNDLVVFDCGAVPPNLIESELFGHEKGSFTGAVMTRQGLFEQADGGTLFLDELGELPIDLQPKLLRALEQREVRRVGSAKAQQGRRPHHRGDQPQPRGRGHGGPVPPGSVLPPQRGAAAPAVAARARRRHPAARPALPRHRLVQPARRTAARKVRGDRARRDDRAAELSVAGQRARAGQRDRARGVVLRQRACSSSPTCPTTCAPRRPAPRARAARRRGPARATSRDRRQPDGVDGSERCADAAAPPDELLAEGVTFKDAKERWVAVVRARLHPPAAPPQHRQHLARRARGRHRPQVLPQADEEVRHRGRRCRRRPEDVVE